MEDGKQREQAQVLYQYIMSKVISSHQQRTLLIGGPDIIKHDLMMYLYTVGVEIIWKLVPAGANRRDS